MLNTYQGYCNNILESLKAIGYSDRTLAKYNNVYSNLLEYLKEKDLSNQTLQSLCIEFLEDFYLITPFKNTSKSDKQKIRVLNFLVDYERSNHFVYHRHFINSPLSHDTTKTVLIDLIENYIHLRVKEYDISKSTELKYRNTLYQFFEFMNSNNICSINNISNETISKYVQFISTGTNSVIYSKLSTLRVFFKYCFDYGILDIDFSLVVPKGNRNRRVHLPSILSQEQKETVLSSINKDDTVGSRNYAILLIASQLGLRASDISNLTFSNIGWEKNTINIIMQKTKKEITLPLTSEIGNAIIVYIKNYRPKSNLPYVFLTHIPPYNKMSSSGLSSMANRIINSSGIKLKSEITSGMHLFRHTLASSLLKNGVDLPTISSVLGHASTITTMVYLHVDIDSLRECALEVPPLIWEGEDFND